MSGQRRFSLERFGAVITLELVLISLIIDFLPDSLGSLVVVQAKPEGVGLAGILRSLKVLDSV